MDVAPLRSGGYLVGCYSQYFLVGCWDKVAGSSYCVFWMNEIIFARLTILINKCIICCFTQSTFDLNPYVTANQHRTAQLITASLHTPDVRARTQDVEWRDVDSPAATGSSQ